MTPPPINPAQAIEALQQIPDAQFDSVFNSPWTKFPTELVRDELVRRLRLRDDLSLDAKKVKYREIIDRSRMVSNPPWGLFSGNPTNENELFGERFLRSLERSRARLEEMNEHYRQLSALHSQRDDPFEGKTKPGDWRPVGAELCPVCDGNGKGADQRICGKCSGRGFIRR
jgi:hypothetical protein